MKNKIFLLIILLSIVCCKKNNKVKESSKISNQETELNKKSDFIKSKTKIYSIEKDTLKIGNSIFYVMQEDPRSEINTDLVILNTKNDTIYRHDGSASNGFVFEDFDENGTLDIRLNHISNSGGYSELIMFDEKTNQFKNVINFDSFNNPIRLKKTKLWYSYHKSGCADINWDSDLFYIQNYKAIRIGNISGRGCEGEPKNGIFINKIIGEKEKLIKEIIRKKGYYGDKWEFIEKYWNENFNKFK